MNQVELIGEYEVTCQPGGEPALLIHHLIQGYDVAALPQAAAAELRALLAVEQKRIRELPGGTRAIFGAGGDLALYRPDGRRACYFSADQAARLARLLQICS